MIRIISGQLKGRVLQCPPTARPPLMKTRQAVFNILAQYISWPGLTVVDCFAGSGAYGLESLSRGANLIYFIEKDKMALRTLSENTRLLHVNDQTHFIRASAPLLPPAPQKADLIFLDPPYHQGLATPTLNALLQGGWADDRTIFVLETQAKEIIDLSAYSLRFERIYGNNRIFIGQMGRHAMDI